MKIIPIIDIKDGKVIEAVGGRRNNYRELSSRICDSDDPFTLSQAYGMLGFTEVYIADLDGILYSKPNYDILQKISEETNIQVMADIGVWSMEDVLNLPKVKPVIATETFSSLNVIKLPKEFVLSLDMREGVFQSAMNLSLEEFIKIIADSAKMKEVLIIDLARVGVAKGPNIELCMKVAYNLPGKTLMYGGGVRNMLDVHMLYEAGISKVLVGSALHSGAILNDIYHGIIKESY
jgi:phosphoribosylformimino-5-aminoimidazole carboxamide ribotide isomerase